MIAQHTPIGMTQSLVQQPRAQRKMNALTQQEARTSNVMVEGIISIMGHAPEYYLILVQHTLLFVQHLYPN